VILGGLVAYISATYFNIKTTQNDIIKDYLEELKDIEKLSSQYWLGDHKNKKSELFNIGVELQARLSATANFLDIAKKYGVIVKGHYVEFKDLDAQLFDLTTGGAFQTAGMRADAENFDQIIQTISKIRRLLRSSRIARYWLH
jgi:hypothetical protein